MGDYKYHLEDEEWDRNRSRRDRYEECAFDASLLKNKIKKGEICSERKNKK